MQIEIADYRSMSIEERLSKLADLNHYAAAALLEQGKIVRSLLDDGYDSEDLRSKVPLLDILLRVGWGQTLPELVLAYRFDRRLLMKVSALPIPTQKQLIDNTPLAVCEPKADGDGYAHRLVPPLKMTGAQLRQVFADDHIRDPAEQISYCVRRIPTRTKAPSNTPMVDRQHRTVRFGEIVVTRDELLDLLRRMG